MDDAAVLKPKAGLKTHQQKHKAATKKVAEVSQKLTQCKKSQQDRFEELQEYGTRQSKDAKQLRALEGHAQMLAAKVTPVIGGPDRITRGIPKTVCGIVAFNPPAIISRLWSFHVAVCRISAVWH